MTEIKIRYTWKRGSDGNIIQRIVDLRSLEEKGLILDFSGYRLIARDIWTGRKDSVGSEIYEKDVLEVISDGILRYLEAYWDDGFCGFITRNIHFPHDTIYAFSWLSQTYKFKVIGNIHLNPELLKSL